MHLLFNCKIHCLNLPRLLWSREQSAPPDVFPLQTLDGIDQVARTESANTAHIPNLYLRAAGRETSTVLSGLPCVDKEVFLTSGKQCSLTCCLDWLQISLWKKLTLVPEVPHPKHSICVQWRMIERKHSFVKMTIDSLTKINAALAKSLLQLFWKGSLKILLIRSQNFLGWLREIGEKW